MKNSAYIVLVVLVFANANIQAQSLPGPVNNPGQKPADQKQKPADQKPGEPQTGETNSRPKSFTDSAPKSFMDGIITSTRNRLGFSFSVDEIYVPGEGSTGSKASNFATVYPTVFTNFHGREWNMSATYSFAYARYGSGTASHSTNQAASLTANRNITRNLSMLLADSFTDGLNEYGYTLMSAVPGQQLIPLDQKIYSPEILVARQRVKTNAFTSSLTYKFRRATTTVFGTHYMLDYEKLGQRAASAIHGGISLDYPISRWFSLTSTYSGHRDWGYSKIVQGDVHRLQAAGLRLRLGRNLEFYSSGGVEYSHYEGSKNLVGSGDGGITYASKSTTFSLIYRRGLSTAFGPGLLLNGHNVAAAATHTQRLSRKIHAQLSAMYNWGKYQEAKIESGTANGNLQFEITPDLYFTTDVGYVLQHVNNLGATAPPVSRAAVYAGLHYFLPPLRGR